MSLLDIDDLDAAVAEAARILTSDGVFVSVVVHPFASAGSFADSGTSPVFVVDASYFDERTYEVAAERDGLAMTFRSWHRPLERYLGVLSSNGLMIEHTREPRLPVALVAQDGSRERWRRVPKPCMSARDDSAQPPGDSGGAALTGAPSDGGDGMGESRQLQRSPGRCGRRRRRA